MSDHIDLPCDDCNASAGEPCRPYCTGLAAYQENLRKQSPAENSAPAIK